MPTNDELFTRSEVLGGFSAKRTRLLLFQIESRTSYLMTQSRRTVSGYLTQEIAEQQDLAFFEALAERHEPPVRPSIQDLERYAPHWRFMVPRNRTLQATLAYLLGQKYRFVLQDIPHIREALGLDSEEVQRSFTHQYHQPLASIYTRQVGPLDWVRWRWSDLSAWLENLPPFWTAYALTFTETVGASILALPIALAGLGPLPGVVILFVMGMINVLTIASMAEAVMRSGSMRYQGGYLGRLVRNYLGRPASILLTTAVVGFTFLLLFAYYLGFSLTLATSTPIPAEIWVGVLFLLGVYFVRQKNLHATVTSALVIGAINLSLVLILSLLALSHLRLENLLYARLPFLKGVAFEPAVLGLIFGVAFIAYFGHFSVNSCARTVLQRDPGGRSLAWGCIAAQLSAMLLYILWVVAVNGAIAPQMLNGFSGTALTPLAQLIGPAVTVFGTIFVVLAMGMASIHFTLALFLTVREWIPGRTRHTLLLGRRQGKLIFTPRGKANVRLTLTYLGLKRMEEAFQISQPQFRLELQQEGNTRRVEIGVNNRWKAKELSSAGEAAGIYSALGSIDLTLSIVTANAESVRVQVETSMRTAYEGGWDTLGFDFLQLVDGLDTPDTAFIRWLAGRKQVSVEEAASFLDQSVQATEGIVKHMVEQGILSETREEGHTLYRVHWAARRRRQATPAIWKALDDSGGISVRRQSTAQRKNKSIPGLRFPYVKELVQGEQARFWLAFSPLILLFLFTEWLLVNKLESFSEVLGFLGVVAVPMVAGIFPILLLVASRRKGEYVPKFFLRFLAHPVVAGALYLVSLGILFLHGLFIWQNVFQRVVAIVMGVIIVGITSMMVLKGTFARRVVIEVRYDPVVEGKDEGTFTVTDSGQAARQATVRLGYTNGEQVFQIAVGRIPTFPELRYAIFQLSLTQAQELMIWVHRVTPEGQSENLPALLQVYVGNKNREFHLDGGSEQRVIPLREIKKEEILTHLDEAEQRQLKSFSQMPLIEVQFIGYPASKNKRKK